MPQGSCVSATIRRSNASEYFSALIFLVSRARVRLKKLRGVDRTPQPFGGLRHVCWVAAPDGAQMELIEKV
jgi:hypothetical protein